MNAADTVTALSPFSIPLLTTGCEYIPNTHRQMSAAQQKRNSVKRKNKLINKLRHKTKR